MQIEESNEYKGYGVFVSLLNKLNKPISRFSKFINKKSTELRFVQYKLIFGERDDDIYIATFPKSGTTMMQMILYQLTTNGEINFNHIYDVSPWIRNESFRNKRPKNWPSPRIIKTHDRHKNFPKNIKGRFIVVHREGMDVAVSFYHQQKNYNDPNLKFEDFIKSFLKGKSWFKFSSEWFRNKNNLTVLYVKYENLLHNKRNEINRIVEFLNLKVNDDQVDRAIHFSSFEYMKEKEDLFGDKPEALNRVYDQFIRKGKKGEGKKIFSTEDKREFEEEYVKSVSKYEEKVFAD